MKTLKSFADWRTEIGFHPIDGKGLAEILELSQPPFPRNRQFVQLKYIESYAKQIECKSIAVEEMYIDRDHIEDHSAFYSRSFFPYAHTCRRVHFFTLESDGVKKEFAKIVEVARKGYKRYKDACKKLSDEIYLGFSVIKPLSGCPVGRTVLKCYPEQSSTPGHTRLFPCTKNYDVHLLGVELSVKGLAFQQQDEGVSACATTALWSAMQKLRDIEEVAAASPAQITILASQYALPLGRSMPSEGLEINQMCQAIQSLGGSPNIIKADNFENARAQIYSAALAGFAPVLIIKRGQQESHAVTVAGMKLKQRTMNLDINGIDDKAGDLIALYIHDDRNGPYVKAQLEKLGTGLQLKMEFKECVPVKAPEEWQLTHILVPTHPKIRLSFTAMRKVALDIVNDFEALRRGVKQITNTTDPITYEVQIVRAHKYIEKFICDGGNVVEFYSRVPLPRYLGVVTIQSQQIGKFELLIDSTSTPRNIHCLGLVERGVGFFSAEEITFLVGQYQCNHIAVNQSAGVATPKRAAVRN